MELLNGVQTDDLKLLVENGGDYWQVCLHGGIMHLFLNISGLVIAAIL
jgi:hypothetical protein